MAKPAWLTTTPSTGSGNGTISNSASPHTGRVARTGTVTVTGTGVTNPVTYQVSQSPKAEFVEFDNGASMSAPKAGGTVTVTGKSNSSKLTFSWAGQVIDVNIPTNYTAGGASASNGAAISGDPGATAQFNFSIALTFPASTLSTSAELPSNRPARKWKRITRFGIFLMKTARSLATPRTRSSRLSNLPNSSARTAPVSLL